MQKIFDMSGYEFRDEKCRYFAGAGSVEELCILRNTIYQPDFYNTATRPLESVEALLFTECGVYRHEGRVWVPLLAPKYAIGSGTDFILSAMELGLNAQNAVKHACKFDTKSGGKIAVVSINKRR